MPADSPRRRKRLSQLMGPPTPARSQRRDNLERQYRALIRSPKKMSKLPGDIAVYRDRDIAGLSEKRLTQILRAAYRKPTI